MGDGPVLCVIVMKSSANNRHGLKRITCNGMVTLHDTESDTDTVKIRMHSSRMRTVRCSSRLLGGMCLPAGGVSDRHPPCGQNDRQMYKHYRTVKMSCASLCGGFHTSETDTKTDYHWILFPLYRSWSLYRALSSVNTPYI